jgi:TonB family protein
MKKCSGLAGHASALTRATLDIRHTGCALKLLRFGEKLIMRKRFGVLLLLLIATASFGAVSVETDQSLDKFAVVRPFPEYPYAARAKWLEGIGLFAVDVNTRTGAVTQVTVRKSTGHKILDDAAQNAFRRWRFRPNLADQFLIPVNFKMPARVHEAPKGARAIAVYAPRPEYPVAARRARMTGRGLFECAVDQRTGAVTGVRVLHSTGHRILDDAAMDALRKWRFRPGTVSTVTMPLTFSLQGYRP